VSRRAFTRGALATAAAAALGGRSTEARPVGPVVPPTGAQDALDEALEMLSRSGFEYHGGLANHGPMAAEALVALGRPEAVRPWVESYRGRLQERGTPRERLAPESWRDCLGDFRRAPDWAGMFARALQDEPWPAVLERWTERLAPGMVGAAMHGLIRTGHAARALSFRDTPARRRELAEGLAYWAARYQVLPESPGGPGTESPSAALARVERLPFEQRARPGLIADGLRALDGWAPFLGVAGLADTSGDASAFLSDLTARCASVYWEEAHDSGRIIGFIHAVTGPSAVRLLLPHVGPAARRALLRYAWQSAAGMYAALSRARSAAALPAAADDWDALVDRALATRDEHAIKFGEACRREDAVRPAAVYRHAARDAADRLGA
jgi:hypothetical protein